jgi:hypothetical protein
MYATSRDGLAMDDAAIADAGAKRLSQIRRRLVPITPVAWCSICATYSPVSTPIRQNRRTVI